MSEKLCASAHIILKIVHSHDNLQIGFLLQKLNELSPIMLNQNCNPRRQKSKFSFTNISHYKLLQIGLYI